MSGKDSIRLEKLEAENEALRRQVADLQRQLDFYETHPTISRGLRGETLFAALLDGELTTHNASHDIVLKNRLKIEVKGSGLNVPVQGASTLRWVWGRPFGEGGNKVYDYLLLVGDADPRFQRHYKDPASPRIVFLVPYAEVAPLTSKVGRSLAIFLISNPLKAKSAAAPLFERYQVTMPELEARFRFEL